MESIKKFFNGNQSVRGASIILIITLTLSNLLGLIRDHFLAQKITTDLLDVYYAAFRLPDFIFNILILGAISSAFIPVFTSYWTRRKPKDAWNAANSFLNVSMILLIILAIILFFLIPTLLPLITSKFNLEKQELAIKLARAMLLSPLFFGLSYIFGGILNSFKRFIVYACAPLIYNLSIILSTIFLADKITVWAPTIGVIIGAFLHMLIQLPAVISLGWRPWLAIDWTNAGLKRIFYLMVPRSLGLGANQVALLIYTAIASTLGAGSIAIFNLADNIQTMPTVVFGTSFATAVFPTLAASHSLNKSEDFSNYLWKAMRSIIYILLPASIGFILLRAQIVRLILGSGYFSWQDTVQTADTLGWFAIALTAQGVIPLFARAFYALHNTKTPTIIGAAAMILSVILGFSLAPRIGVSGLALAFSCGGLLNVILLYFFLRNKTAWIKKGEWPFIKYLGKIVFAAVAMTLVVQISKYLIGSWVDMDRFWGVLVQTIGAITLGGIIYLWITWLIQCEEIGEAWVLFKNKFVVRNATIDTD